MDSWTTPLKAEKHKKLLSYKLYWQTFSFQMLSAKSLDMWRVVTSCH